MFFILTPPRFLRFPNDGRPRKDPARAPVRLFPQNFRPRTIARTPRARAAFSEIRGRTLRDKNGGAPTFPPMLPKCPHSARSAPFASRRILLFGRTARGDAGFFAPYAHMPARTSVRAGIKNPFFSGRIKPEAADAPTRKDREDLFAGGQALPVRLFARRAAKCAANRSGTARPHRRTTRTADENRPVAMPHARRMRRQKHRGRKISSRAPNAPPKHARERKIIPPRRMAPHGRTAARLHECPTRAKESASRDAEGALFFIGSYRMYSQIAQRWTLPEASPPASARTSAAETMLKSPSTECLRQDAATANSIASCVA